MFNGVKAQACKSMTKAPPKETTQLTLISPSQYYLWKFSNIKPAICQDRSGCFASDYIFYYIYIYTFTSSSPPLPTHSCSLACLKAQKINTHPQVPPFFQVYERHAWVPETGSPSEPHLLTVRVAELHWNEAICSFDLVPAISCWGPPEFLCVFPTGKPSLVTLEQNMGKYEGKLTIMRVWLVWLEMSRRILEMMSRDFTCLFRFGATMLTRVKAIYSKWVKKHLGTNHSFSSSIAGSCVYTVPKTKAIKTSPFSGMVVRKVSRPAASSSIPARSS